MRSPYSHRRKAGTPNLSRRGRLRCPQSARAGQSRNSGESCPLGLGGFRLLSFSHESPRGGTTAAAGGDRGIIRLFENQQTGLEGTSAGCDAAL